ncbi:MAG TPA: hypothetical protein VFR68_06955 [Candidatus Dormibacteraeota bacterium]|nr:hypothetical protein [Candidatus Dormibacteraeota bacterium]
MKKVTSRLNLDVLRSLLKRGAIPYVIAAAIVLLGVSGVAAATGTFSSSPSATPASSVSAVSSPTGQVSGFQAAGGGDNIVQVINRTDGKIKMDGRVKLDKIPGPNVGPKNEAFAFSSCTDCDTLAVALQIDLTRADSHHVQPFNKAMAVNFQCTRCVTVALAYQYVIPVADPNQVPSDVREMIRQMNDQLGSIRSPHESLSDAANQVEAVISHFQEYAGDLIAGRDQATDATTPGATPIPAESPSAGATVSASPTDSSTPTPQATVSPSP